MTDRQIIIGFMITAMLLVLLIFVSFFLEGNIRHILLEENGLVESASAFGYFLCAVFILYKGKLVYLKRKHYFFFLIIFFMLRELDFNARFTTMSISKTRFFISSHVPLIEKFIGVIVFLFLLYIIFSILYFHLKDFYYGLKNRSTTAIGALIVIAFLVMSQVLDGIDRRLDEFGVKLGERVSMHASAMEEILEMGIPIILILTFCAYFRDTA